ncbi:hypothetical protein CY34DRAFT_108952 [Suillus luteus UH-Slu-Lm8-n1]|uniref:Uncharacterized protein n=1 Tax=Suillus luteus UH-Slu-Lm8-n1 TaxID=930992 RepID=A0A0D0AI03_9AGAM|nr:hypothetical protein CY34DRAFT_108952 [Suillus luteus UH-Slu-Lm8-n1]
MEAPSSPSSTITAPPDYTETARRLAKMIVEAMTCDFAFMHYDSASEYMIEWRWPIGCDGKRVPPSHLKKHRDGYDFRFPCCLCADGGGRGAYVESAVYSWWDESTKKTDWIARCTANRCGYQAEFQYPQREQEVLPEAIPLEWTYKEQKELLNRLDSCIGNGISETEFRILFRRCKKCMRVGARPVMNRHICAEAALDARRVDVKGEPCALIEVPVSFKGKLPRVPREQPPQYELNTTLGKDRAGRKNLMTLEKGPQILIPNDVFTGGFTPRKMRLPSNRIFKNPLGVVIPSSAHQPPTGANSSIFAEGTTPNRLQPSPVLPSSPSLTMYLVPEELEAGPSGYFDSSEHSKAELEEELESFFRDPESASPDLPPPSDGQDQASITTIWREDLAPPTIIMPASSHLLFTGSHPLVTIRTIRDHNSLYRDLRIQVYNITGSYHRVIVQLSILRKLSLGPDSQLPKHVLKNRGEEGEEETKLETEILPTTLNETCKETRVRPLNIEGQLEGLAHQLAHQAPGSRPRDFNSVTDLQTELYILSFLLKDRVYPGDLWDIVGERGIEARQEETLRRHQLICPGGDSTRRHAHVERIIMDERRRRCQMEVSLYSQAIELLEQHWMSRFGSRTKHPIKPSTMQASTPPYYIPLPCAPLACFITTRETTIKDWWNFKFTFGWLYPFSLWSTGPASRKITIVSWLLIFPVKRNNAHLHNLGSDLLILQAKLHRAQAEMELYTMAIENSHVYGFYDSSLSMSQDWIVPRCLPEEVDLIHSHEDVEDEDGDIGGSGSEDYDDIDVWMI